ncbi:NmrA-like family domain-containing protein 1 [Seminavis robusta]|uniref:NmrA-like family domain-containing protein 1 n=1 Tax=Seminavis robusta TaxID=568900 RepID=A0A9N8D5I0_9STRA|nr:NmrA-like family domain-containing protein 1 [Seminavis robusta]|eukprot:Sro10_g008100.1 NmrA-like family domain-containing protein 1 (725) ;mRNA; f:114732-117036
MATADGKASSKPAGSSVALVFGASGEQGRAVMEGLVDHGFSKVYGFTRLQENREDVRYLQDALGCLLIQGDIANIEEVEKALKETRADCIFLVTTTELPTEIGQTTGCWNAMEAEFEVIQQFFDVLLKVHKQDGLPRHVVFSTKDNVHQLYHSNNENSNMDWKDLSPMDDGSIVPHYSAKGKGAGYAKQLLQDTPGASGLALTLVTLPFVYSNFLGFFTPLPVSSEQDKHNANQWSISASLGDGSKPLDMMSVSDLSNIIPRIFEQPERYRNQNIRLSACRISMDEIAAHFSDLFGKDVIYNPLLPQEVAALPFPSAPAMAQMCQYLQQCAPPHDMGTTQTILEASHRKPQSFQDWLLTHSDSSAFERVGLDLDAPEISSVVVFGATSPQGRSVIRGLLNDTRKQYTVRAACLDVASDAAKALESLDTERVTLVATNLDDVASCQAAAEGVDGAFLVTDFYQDSAQANVEVEQQHAKNVIDACEAASSIKHLVFSTMDNVEGMMKGHDNNGNKDNNSSIVDAKAKAAAYARTKKLSVTYVILPCYSELFLDMIQRLPVPTPKSSNTSNDADTAKLVLTIPLKNDEKVMCMSVDDLGPAVSNIFDSYQVYAGHEIGLVTDFVSVSEIRDMLNVVIQGDDSTDNALETKTVPHDDWVASMTASTSVSHSYMKDLGQIFAYLSHTDAVKKRHSIAKTMKLVPSARPLKLWVEQNKDNPSFREKLGLR